MRLTVVGSGTMVPDPERVGACVWIEGDDTRVLVDIGWGALHRLERLGCAWRGVDRILLTHFHGDHTGNLPALMAVLDHGLDERRDAPLEILGGPGLRDRLKSMAGAFGGFVTDPSFPLTVTELAPGDDLRLGGLALECEHAAHKPESLGYRLSAGPGRTVGITGDTGPSEALAAFMAGVDVLVIECAFPDPPPNDKHLSPRGLAGMLRIASPGLALLTHVYPEHDPGEFAAAVREAGYDGEVRAARDGTAVDLPRASG